MGAWIGVDFDGTLAMDLGEVDENGFGIPGPPIQPMLERVQRWLTEKRLVKIVSCRARDPQNTKIVHDWLLEHGLPSLVITESKDRYMIALYDDRAITVERNTGAVFSEIDEDYSGRIGRHRPRRQ